MNIIFSYNVKKTYAVENVINLCRNKYGIGYDTNVMNSSAEKNQLYCTIRKNVSTDLSV